MYHSRKMLVVFTYVFVCLFVCLFILFAGGNKQTAVCSSELTITQKQASANQTQIANHANVTSYQ